MNLSTNQNRHLYVASAYNTVADNSGVGTIQAKVSGANQDKELYFIFKGPDTTLRSDRIPLKNINYIKAIPAQALREPLKTVKLELDSAVSANLVSGQDYVLRIAFRQFYGMSDQDQYFKDAVVHCTDAMVSTPSLFWNKMKESLDLAFAREVGATKTSNPYLTFTASSTYLTITEKEQGWTKGIGALERVYFEVIPTTIFLGGDDVVWGKVTDQTPAVLVKKGGNGADANDLVPNSGLTVGTNAIGNGKKIADLEWFCMGERGDQYREMGYPNYIPTKYLVDETKEYDVLEIHFAFTDTGVNSYRSEKDITIVAPLGNAGAHTIMNAVIGGINSAASLEIATL